MVSRMSTCASRRFSTRMVFENVLSYGAIVCYVTRVTGNMYVGRCCDDENDVLDCRERVFFSAKKVRMAWENAVSS